MVRYDSLSHVFSYAWDHVVSCYWKKYPNEFSRHVLSEDVLDRRMIDGDKLYTKRILGKTNPLPQWGTAIFPSHLTKVAFVLEESVVDPVAHTMVSYTWNITYRGLMEIKEKITLNGESATTTSCNKEGWADSSATGFRRVLRKFGIQRWKSNAAKAFEGYETTLEKFSNSDVKGLHQVDYSAFSHLPSLKENALETIKDAKDKAKHKAMDLAHLAKVQKQKDASTSLS